MNLKRILEIERAKIDKILDRKPAKKSEKEIIEENREKWLWLRDTLLKKIEENEFSSVFAFKVANEIIYSLDKALRGADKPVNISFIKQDYVITDGEQKSKIVFRDGKILFENITEEEKEEEGGK
jgi:hypothetical protein